MYVVRTPEIEADNFYPEQISIINDIRDRKQTMSVT
jgi:hypothetical protein